MTTQNHGFSKRSLLLLGGLTAAVTSPNGRRKLSEVLQNASQSAQAVYQEAQQTYHDTVKPIALQAQGQLVSGVQELAQVAAERGSDLASRAHEQGGRLAEQGGKLAEQSGKLAGQGGELASKLLSSKLAEQGTQVAASAVVTGGKLAQGLLGSVAELREVGSQQAQSLGQQAQSFGQQTQAFLSTAQNKLSDVQEQVQDRAEQARKEAGKVGSKQLRQLEQQSALKAAKTAALVKVLEKNVGKKVLTTKKQLVKRGKQASRLALAESKLAQSTLAKSTLAQSTLARPKAKSGGLSGFLIGLGLLVGGGVLLARVPTLRHNILKVVRGFSPEAADALHTAGTGVRDLVGSIWLERIEPETATQATAPKASQATASAAAAATEPGSPAQTTSAQATPVTLPKSGSKPSEESAKN